MFYLNLDPIFTNRPQKIFYLKFNDNIDMYVDICTNSLIERSLYFGMMHIYGH